MLDRAVALAGYKKAAAKLTKNALLRNLDIAEKLGCLDDAGLAEMRRGKAATVRKGPYKGDELSVDHIVPRAVVPELDNVIANLELMPLRMNEKQERQDRRPPARHGEEVLSGRAVEQEGTGGRAPVMNCPT